MRLTTLPWLVLITVIASTALSLLSAPESSGLNQATAVQTPSVSSLPMWSFTTTASRDGMTYGGTMLGRSPFFHGARTTSINTVLLPVRLTITDASNVATVFDPSQPDPGCLPNSTTTALDLTKQSPIFMPTSFTINGIDVGTTQYVDAFQRANFYNLVNPTGNRYHLLLNLSGTIPDVSFAVSSPDGATTDGKCGKIGVIDRTKFDPEVAQLLAFYHENQPTTLPVFLFYNVVMTEGSPNQADPLGASNCCMLGYNNAVPALSGIQLYTVAEYGSNGSFKTGADVAALAGEIGELIDNPNTINPTPSWGHIGSVSTCQNTIQVGAPLDDTFAVTMPNGISYHPQELAFFSWFFGAPSIGAGGKFSDNGTFTTDAGAICQ